MSWRFVFNTTVSDKIWWGHIRHAIDAAEAAGYEFLTWNGLVYNIKGELTNFKVEDLF